MTIPLVVLALVPASVQAQGVWGPRGSKKDRQAGTAKKKADDKASKFLTTFDTDKDGTVGSKEQETYLDNLDEDKKKKWKEILKKIDTNSDGELKKSEIVAYYLKSIKAKDKAKAKEKAEEKEAEKKDDTAKDSKN